MQKQALANVYVTMEIVKEALDLLRGAVMIVYPMGLPPHDPIRMELEEKEDLSGTQVHFTFQKPKMNIKGYIKVDLPQSDFTSSKSSMFNPDNV